MCRLPTGEDFFTPTMLLRLSPAILNGVPPPESWTGERKPSGNTGVQIPSTLAEEIRTSLEGGRVTRDPKVGDRS